jgi:hypothetical protein
MWLDWVMSGCPIARMKAHQSTWHHASSSSHRCVADLDVEVIAVFLKYSTTELGPIVSDDPIWDPEPT